MLVVLEVLLEIGNYAIRYFAEKNFRKYVDDHNSTALLITANEFWDIFFSNDQPKCMISRSAAIRFTAALFKSMDKEFRILWQQGWDSMARR